MNLGLWSAGSNSGPDPTSTNITKVTTQNAAPPPSPATTTLNTLGFILFLSVGGMRSVLFRQRVEAEDGAARRGRRERLRVGGQTQDPLEVLDPVRLSDGKTSAA